MAGCAAPTSPSLFPDADVEAWVEATAEHGPRLSGDLLEDTAEHVWGPHLRWLSGAPAGDCAASGERLAEVFLSEASGEAARVAAAYGLGRSGQLEPLVAELDCAGQERRFRAACHGLGAAGDVALPALVAALEAPSPKSDRPLFRKEKICHAIGNAAGPATLVEGMRALSHAAEAACKTNHLLKKVFCQLQVCSEPLEFACEVCLLFERAVCGCRGGDSAGRFGGAGWRAARAHRRRDARPARL